MLLNLNDNVAFEYMIIMKTFFFLEKITTTETSFWYKDFISLYIYEYILFTADVIFFSFQSDDLKIQCIVIYFYGVNGLLSYKF